MTSTLACVCVQAGRAVWAWWQSAWDGGGVRSALAASVLLLLMTSAFGHDTWPSGQPIQDWIKASCCGMSEAHRFEQSQVHHLGDGGWLVDGYPWIVRLQPL